MTPARVWRCLAFAALLLAAGGTGCGKKEGLDGEEKKNPAGHGDNKPAYHGVHGKTDSKWIHGWAWDKNNPDATLKVDIYEGDRLLDTIPASRFRQDLYDAKIGTGKYGFDWRVPASLRDGRPHNIRITISGTNVALKNTPKTLTSP